MMSEAWLEKQNIFYLGGQSWTWQALLRHIMKLQAQYNQNGNLSSIEINYMEGEG